MQKCREQEIYGRRHKKANLNEVYKIQTMSLNECLSQLLKKKEKIKEEILLLREKYKEGIEILVSMRGISVFTP